MVEIRRERPQDHVAVRAVHRAAFGEPEQVGDVVEAVLVDRLRDGPWWLPRLSLVAIVDGAVSTGSADAPTPASGRSPPQNLAPVGAHEVDAAADVSPRGIAPR